MTGQSGREVELKLGIRPPDAARIARLDRLSRMRIGPPHAEQIYTLYYDTPEHALRQDGHCLRLRYAGARRLQSIKSAPRDGALAADRAEDEVAITGTGPDLAAITDPDLRARVSELAQGAALKPLFETDVLRITRLLKSADGDTVELALDQGTVRANGLATPICELELELKSGRPALLYTLAQQLNAKGRLRLLTLTKADRGFGLLGEPVIGSVKGGRPVLDPDATLGEAFSAILKSCLAHLCANEPAVTERQDAEGLHQMRVGLRRLRVALSSFASSPAAPAIGPLAEEARWLARSIGPARDVDVYLDTMLPAAKAAFPAETETFAALTAALGIRRAEAWAEVLASVESKRFTAFALSVAAFAEHPAGVAAEMAGRTTAWSDPKEFFAAPARAFAAATLGQQFAAAVPLARRMKQLSVAKRHKLRRRLKALRYTAEFFSSLFDDTETKRFVAALTKLQDRFGLLNDLAVARALTEDLASHNALEAEPIAWAGGLCVGWHAHAAEAAFKKAPKRWRALAEWDPFWQDA